MIDCRNRVLFVMDLSNFEYQTVFSAERDWKKMYPDESSFLMNKWITDQDNLPDLLNHQTYRRVLNRTVQTMFDKMLGIAKKWHQSEIDSAEGMDVFLTEDDRLAGNFRKKLYPEYKQQRKAKLYEFDVFKSIDYVRNVVFKDLGFEDKLGYKIVKVEDCESDDIIAVLMNRYKDYMCRILISSDRDYLQLENVNQYNGFGIQVEPYVKTTTGKVILERKDFLLWKIIRGDPSDNIKGLFPGVGDVKSIPLAQDREKLKQLLREDNAAAMRYKLNRELIDFRKIPQEIVTKIGKALDEKMAEIVPEEKIDFGECIVVKRKEG